MYEIVRAPIPRARLVGLVLLGACTLWLVVQNTLLLLAMLWTDPRRVLAVGAALTKAAGAVVAGFWTSPAAALVVTTVAIAALSFPVLRARGAGAAEEARNG